MQILILDVIYLIPVSHFEPTVCPKVPYTSKVVDLIWCMRRHDCQQSDLISSGLLSDLIFNINRFPGNPTSKPPPLYRLHELT